jgi:hypothetical protein
MATPPRRDPNHRPTETSTNSANSRGLYLGIGAVILLLVLLFFGGFFTTDTTTSAPATQPANQETDVITSDPAGASDPATGADDTTIIDVESDAEAEVIDES